VTRPTVRVFRVFRGLNFFAILSVVWVSALNQSFAFLAVNKSAAICGICGKVRRPEMGVGPRKVRIAATRFIKLQAIVSRRDL
jgi:hypothetical protein